MFFMRVGVFFMNVGCMLSTCAVWKLCVLMLPLVIHAQNTSGSCLGFLELRVVYSYVVLHISRQAVIDALTCHYMLAFLGSCDTVCHFVVDSFGFGVSSGC